MKDFFGNEINVGDVVAHQVGGRYPTLEKCRVIDFTPKRVKVLIEGQYSPSYVYPEKLVVPVVQPDFKEFR